MASVVVQSLKGSCEQVPPAYSAISIDGKRAYERARAGEDVAIAPRQVTIYDARLLGVERGERLVWNCSFHVSKGTYVRSMARDLGRSLNSAAHLCGLRRTSSGPISLDQCVTLEELERVGSAGVSQCCLDPVWALQLSWHELNDYEREAVAVGRQFGCRSVTTMRGARRPPQEGERVSLVCDGRLMGVWQERGARLACVANFPDGIAGVA